MPRRTINIPESQRHTVGVKLRLDPEAAEVLETVPKGKRSEYVSDLIVDDGGHWGTTGERPDGQT